MRGKFHRAFQDNDQIVFSRVTPEHRMKIGRDEYFRYPQEGEDDLVAMTVENAQKYGYEVEGVVALEDVTRLNWKQLAATPSGRKASGNLGKDDEQPVNPNKVKIKNTVMVSDAPDDVLLWAETKAVMDTDYYNPQTPEEIEKCIEQRVWIATQHIMEYGFEVERYTEYTSWDPSMKINWHEGTILTYDGLDPSRLFRNSLNINSGAPPG
jgi:hypothetical protein